MTNGSSEKKNKTQRLRGREKAEEGRARDKYGCGQLLQPVGCRGKGAEDAKSHKLHLFLEALGQPLADCNHSTSNWARVCFCSELRDCDI